MDKQKSAFYNGKEKKAIELGVTIMTVEQLEELLNQ